MKIYNLCVQLLLMKGNVFFVSSFFFSLFLPNMESYCNSTGNIGFAMVCFVTGVYFSFFNFICCVLFLRLVVVQMCARLHNN